MEKIIKAVINKAAKIYKGKSYEVDQSIPLMALLGYSRYRLLSLLRCVLRGIKLSMDPRDLVFVGSDVDLRYKRGIRFGRGVVLARGVSINGLAEQGITLGDRVSIGAYSIIESSAVITKVGVGCHIGNDSGIGDFSFVGASGGVWIGSNVIIGQRVSFHSENHCFDRMDLPIRMQGVTRKGIRIEDDCWVGANVTFLDGANVGKGCVVAAGAVVKGVIPPYSVVAGIPGKVIKTRHDIAHKENGESNGCQYIVSPEGTE
jgi:acetyltransferase-like isoleucine patch superfamily enzyme